MEREREMQNWFQFRTEETIPRQVGAVTQLTKFADVRRGLTWEVHFFMVLKLLDGSFHLGSNLGPQFCAVAAVLGILKSTCCWNPVRFHTHSSH